VCVNYKGHKPVVWLRRVPAAANASCDYKSEIR